MIDFNAVAAALLTLKTELNNAPKIKDGKINGNKLSTLSKKAVKAIKAAGDPDAVGMVREVTEPYIAGMRK